MADVRSGAGVPVINDFTSSRGTPIIIDTNTGLGYVLINNAVQQLNFVNGQFILPYAGVGIPQLKFQGSTAARYALVRCSGDGGDDGDFLFFQTGSTIWHQSLTNNYPCVMDLLPKGTSATNAAVVELYGTDYLADATNYRRVRLSANGTAGTEHELSSDQGGAVSALPLHIYIAGVNGIYLKSNGTNGIGTTSPRRKWDILDGSNQLRLSESDNAVYWDFDVDASDQLELTPSDPTAEFRVNARTIVVGGMKIEVVATGSLPAAGASEDGRVLIEDAGAGASNFVWYKGGQRFKTAGTLF